MLEKYTNIPSGSEQYSPEFIEENGVLLLEKKDKCTRIAVSEKTPEKIRYTAFIPPGKNRFCLCTVRRNFFMAGT